MQQRKGFLVEYQYELENHRLEKAKLRVMASDADEAKDIFKRGLLDGVKVTILNVTEVKK